MMRHFFILIAIFGLLFCDTTSGIKAQKVKTDSLQVVLQVTQIDSIKLNTLNKLTVYLRRSFPDSALFFAQQAELLALKLNNKNKLAECYKNIGNIYNGKDRFKLAIEYYEKSVQLYQATGDSLGIAKNYNNLGALNRNLGNFKASLEYYQKSLELRQLSDDQFGMGITYNNIGNIHYDQGDFDLALDYYFKSLEIRNKFHDKMGVAGCYNNIGSIYSEKKDYTKAIKHFKRALDIYIEFEDKLGKAHAYKNIALSYIKSKDYNQALNYLNQSLVIDIELGDKLGISTTLTQLARVHNSQQKYNQAKDYATKSLAIAKETGAIREKKDAYQQLSVACEGLAEYQKALDYHKKYLQAKDSIFSIEKIKELESAKKKYQLEKKQLQIENLENQNQLKTVKLEKLRIRLILFSIVILLFIAFVVHLLVVRKKLKRKNITIFEQNEEITAQKDELEKHRTDLENLVNERTIDLELAKQRAEESDKLKSSFLANMSHEIRTPMNAIIGFSNLLVQDNMDKNTKENYKHEITSNCLSLLNLVENILDLAKIQTNQIVIHRKEFNLNDLLDDIYYSFTEIAHNKKLNLIFKPNQENITLKTDPFRLKQVLTNLIDNAIKFTEEGFVKVGYTQENDDIIFYVKDTGIGMTEKQLRQLFTRFSKFEKQKQKLYGGAGLGLAICKHITNLLEGDIWAESTPENRKQGKQGQGGSIFYLQIPAFIDKRLKEKAETENKYYQKNWNDKTILIAEDDPSNFYYFQMLLSETKMTIQHAKTGNEAVQKAKDLKPDVILMDIKMPQMDGLKATQIIKKEFPNIPIIAQTAFSMENDEESSLQAGCDAYISKPIQKHQLFNLLNRFLS